MARQTAAQKRSAARSMLNGNIGNIRYNAMQIRELASAFTTLGMEPTAERLDAIARSMESNCDFILLHALEGGGR